MYIGEIGMRGFRNMIAYVLDELLGESNKPTRIKICFEKENQVRVEATHINAESLTQLLKSLYKQDIGYRFAFPILVALSEETAIQVTDTSAVTKLSARKGDFTVTTSIAESQPQTLILEFKPDFEIFKSLEIDYEIFNGFARKYAFLNPPCHITSIDRRSTDEQKNTYHYPRGVAHQLDYKIGEQLYGNPQVRFDFDTTIGEHHYRISFCWMDLWLSQTYIASYANNDELIFGGSLVDGVLEGIIAAIKKAAHGREKVAINRKNASEKLILLAAVQGNDFVFGGSVKGRLEMPEMKKQVKKYIFGQLNEYFATHPEAFEMLIGNFKVWT